MPDRDRPAPQHEIDAHTLTRTQLRERYSSTYSSWRNMKQRGNSEGAIISPEFEDFVHFLIAVGPRPHGHSIDRIDHSNPEYGPGLVRWLDVRGQANNRSTTIMLTVDGETKPLSVWAEETSQKADTLRARLANGLSHREVIYGKMSSQKTYSDPWNYRPWPKDPIKYKKWEDLYQDRGTENQLPVDFFVKRLQADYFRVTDYLENNDFDQDEAYISGEMKKMRAEANFIEPHLQRALSEQREVRSIINRSSMPHGWCGPRRFRQRSN